MSTTSLNSPVSPLDHVDGPVESPATVVMYGDYECPYTRHAHQLIRLLQKRLPGAVRYAYRHFPLRHLHPHAQLAAEATEAAAEVGRFWAMHDTLVLHRDALGEPSLLEYGSRIGLDRERLAWQLTIHALAERVEIDVQSGLASGVHGTPTLFINHVRYVGERNLRALGSAIRERTMSGVEVER